MSSSNNAQTNPETITPTTTTNNNSNTTTNGDDKLQQMECRCSGIWYFFCRELPRKGDGQSSRGQDNSYERRVGKLEKNLNEIEQCLNVLENFHISDSRNELHTHLTKLKEIVESEKQERPGTETKDPVWIPKISKEIMKFKQQISLTDNLSGKLSLIVHLQSSTGSKGGSAVDELGNVHQSASFRSSSFYKEIQEIFDKLDGTRKFLLSCFTVFPENAVVKRRIFVYWGLGEDMLDAPGTNGNASVPEEKTPEKIVDSILEEFREEGLIEAITKKRKQREHIKSYKMHPLVRSAVIEIHKPAGFFYYDKKGNVLPQRDWASGLDPKGMVVAEENVLLPECNRMCLLKAEEHEQLLERKPTQMPKPTQMSDEYLEKIVTLFNVNEPFPDLELALLTKLRDKKDVGQLSKEPSALDWLSKMKNAKVVCLGSWPGSAKPHIEVESTEFLKGLTRSKDLRFLSLQGVSRITELPDSIGKHSKLVILDLKECHNLEMLSEEITKLKQLRYLDLSDCYLLARMPKGLGALSELRVLKGFVISSSGTLDDLRGLRKLRKLTINASSEKFPTPRDLSALHDLGELGVLRKLTIAWGAKLADREGNGAKREYQNGREGSCWERVIPCIKQQKRNDRQIEKLPGKLEKLDLQCFPMSKAKWLTPEYLPKLEKLYIRGGNLATLDRREWLNVRALRLKYLGELKMNWRELKDSFPNLVYLEKVKCPGITLCPCDQHGVWMTDP